MCKIYYVAQYWREGSFHNEEWNIIRIFNKPQNGKWGGLTKALWAEKEVGNSSGAEQSKWFRGKLCVWPSAPPPSPPFTKPQSTLDVSREEKVFFHPAIQFGNLWLPFMSMDVYGEGISHASSLTKKEGENLPFINHFHFWYQGSIHSNACSFRNESFMVVKMSEKTINIQEFHKLVCFRKCMNKIINYVSEVKKLSCERDELKYDMFLFCSQ